MRAKALCCQFRAMYLCPRPDPPGNTRTPDLVPPQACVGRLDYAFRGVSATSVLLVASPLFVRESDTSTDTTDRPRRRLVIEEAIQL
jgi:hypothetical protein